MNQPLWITIFFVASCAISTGATGQKVYRCGSEYSQIPCADGITVNVDDSRSKAQKVESDTATQQQAARAETMEKERLKDEARLRKVNAPAAAPKAVASDDKGKKVHHKKKKEPEFFTARTLNNTARKTKSAKSGASAAP